MTNQISELRLVADEAMTHKGGCHGSQQGAVAELIALFITDLWPRTLASHDQMITGGAVDNDTIGWAQPLWVNVLFAQR